MVRQVVDDLGGEGHRPEARAALEYLVVQAPAVELGLVNAALLDEQAAS
ncbi:hypothetical protein ACIQI7_11080 [Kitasatospora sp. NPDC092039]